MRKENCTTVMIIFTLTKNIYDTSVNTDSDVIGDDASCNSPVTN